MYITSSSAVKILKIKFGVKKTNFLKFKIEDNKCIAQVKLRKPRLIVCSIRHTVMHTQEATVQI